MAPSLLRRLASLGAIVVAFALLVPPAAAADLQWNGFALLRPQTQSSGVPLDEDSASAQVQLGVDWRPAPAIGAHVHVLARNDADGSRRGRVGAVEAFVEANANFGRDRLRVLGGAFFLPTSRENIDALWESPYTITPSALNSWLREEFRPWESTSDGVIRCEGSAPSPAAQRSTAAMTPSVRFQSIVAGRSLIAGLSSVNTSA